LALTVPVDQTVPRTADIVPRLSAALRGEFQNVLEPDMVEGAPLEVPYVAFQGKSAQFTFSPVQLDYEVEFTGSFRTDYVQCKDFIANKAARLLSAWEQVDARPVWEGLVVTLQASTGALDDPVALRHISETLLHIETPDEMLGGVSVNYKLFVLDKYDATIGVGEYERRNVQQQIKPGMTPKPIRPWDAKLVDRGLQVVVEVNNRLGAMVEEKHTRVTEAELRFMNGLTWHVVEHVAAPLVMDGVLNTRTLEEVVA
jgi:hypothetical protein